MASDLVLVAVPFLAVIALGAVMIDLCRLLEHKPRHAAVEENHEGSHRSPAARSRP